MAHIAIIGAGIGGVPCAFELRSRLGKEHRVTLIGSSPFRVHTLQSLDSCRQLAFEEVPGLGPEGFTQSVCTHSMRCAPGRSTRSSSPIPVRS